MRTNEHKKKQQQNKINFNFNPLMSIEWSHYEAKLKWMDQKDMVVVR